jgi:hypothetical protein
MTTATKKPTTFTVTQTGLLGTLFGAEQKPAYTGEIMLGEEFKQERSVQAARGGTRAMPLITAYQKYVDDFFAAIAPFEKAFQHVGFSYLAAKNGAQFEIVCGRVFLNTAPAPPIGQPQHFASTNIRATHYRLSDLGRDVRGLITQLIEGELVLCTDLVRWHVRRLIRAISSGGFAKTTSRQRPDSYGRTT